MNDSPCLLPVTSPAHLHSPRCLFRQCPSFVSSHDLPRGQQSVSATHQACIEGGELPKRGSPSFVPFTCTVCTAPVMMAWDGLFARCLPLLEFPLSSVPLHQADPLHRTAPHRVASTSPLAPLSSSPGAPWSVSFGCCPLRSSISVPLVPGPCSSFWLSVMS